MNQNVVDLTELADRFRTDKGTVDGDGHHYTELYAAIFEAFRLRKFNLLEIGLLRAANSAQEANPAMRIGDRIPSIEMWLQYFPNATCFGFDMSDFSSLENPRFKFIRGDLSNDSDLEKLVQTVPEPFLIIDDASHASFHQQRAFMRLFPILEPGGFYAIEDLHYSPPVESTLPPCRPFWQIVEEFLACGQLRLDFATAEESSLLAGEIVHSFVHRNSRGGPGWGPKLVIFQKKQERKSIESKQHVSATEFPRIDKEWISSRLFTFTSSLNKKVLSSSIRFDPNGRISGYRHVNEAAWDLIDGRLVVLRADGVAGCIATGFVNEKGTVSFAGKFLLASSNIIHRFEENPLEHGYPLVASFDLFDTLVGRRCYDPLAIFDFVAKKSGVKDFASWRKTEELALWQAGDYSMGDIYAALGASTSWPNVTLNRLRMLELAEEWDNIFPIAETVARVRPGDLIVSDMYLPLSFLRRVVEEKCGLRDCAIHLTSHGKYRGDIWPRIRTTNRIIRHYGDNQNTDIEGPKRAGINVEHVTISRWTRGEKTLIDLGLRQFAGVIREARLASFETDVVVRNAQLAQFDVNIPLLVVATLYLLQQSKEQEIDTLLMCARDCNLWWRLMHWMASRSDSAPHVRYLIASRILFLSHSPEYEAYFFQARGDRNILIDVSGTGRSPAYFLGSLADSAKTGIFLLAGSDEVAGYVKQFAPGTDSEVLSIQGHEKRLGIECLNTCLESRAQQMVFAGHDFETLYEPNEFGDKARKTIIGMGSAFHEFMSRLAKSDMRKLPGEVSAVDLQSSAELLIDLVGPYRNCLLSITRDVNREEVHISQSALVARQRNLARINSG